MGYTESLIITVDLILAGMMFFWKKIAGDKKVELTSDDVRRAKGYLSPDFVVGFLEDRQYNTIIKRLKQKRNGQIILTVLLVLVELPIIKDMVLRITLLVLGVACLVYAVLSFMHYSDRRAYTCYQGASILSYVEEKRGRNGSTVSVSNIVVAYKTISGIYEGRRVNTDSDTYSCIKLTHTCTVVMRGREFITLLPDDRY
ncbi:MAG: hypothetical protein IKO61_08715 [Lachnospiraceae bacterium]|nr:hypothetical protein [Lachnospiraceae bacterium]